MSGPDKQLLRYFDESFDRCNEGAPGEGDHGGGLRKVWKGGNVDLDGGKWREEAGEMIGRA